LPAAQRDLTLPKLCLALSCGLLKLLWHPSQYVSLLLFGATSLTVELLSHTLCHSSLSCLFSVLSCGTRISCAASVLGALRKSVLVMPCSQWCMVYQAKILGVLLYAVETWPVKQREVHTLDTFHQHCLRTSLGISRALQISQHISNEEVRNRAGLPVSLADLHTNTCKYIHTHTHTCTHTHTRTHTNTHEHTQTHTNTHYTTHYTL